MIWLALAGFSAFAADITVYTQNFNSGFDNPASGDQNWTAAVPTIDDWKAVGSNGSYNIRPDSNNLGGTWGSGSYADNVFRYDGATYRNFTLSVDTFTNSANTIGIAFRYVDSRNYYLFLMVDDWHYPAASNGADADAPSSGYILLYRIVNGTGTQLDRISAGPEMNATRNVRITVSEATIKVDYDRNDDGDYSDANEGLFNYVDASPRNVAGKIGFYSYSNDTARFDNVVVTQPDTDNDTIIDEVDNCPSNANTDQADLDNDKVGNVCDTDVDGDGKSGLAADCNDFNASIYAGAPETVGDGIDSDCDTKELCYADVDQDGYVSVPAYPTAPATIVENTGDVDLTCERQEGEATAYNKTDNTKNDCNDTVAAISPAGTEVCDGANVDEDCDTKIDDADTSATGKTPFYFDSDNDTFGAGAAVQYCDPPAKWVEKSNDCNDNVATINPGGQEICDAANVDEDCDTFKDDADTTAIGKTGYYLDSDSDTYGAGSQVQYCDPPAKYIVRTGDCNDSVAAINPGAQEVCDASNVDEDCDLTADDLDTSATGKSSYYLDGDSDTYGAGAAVQYCDAPAKYIVRTGDCNDSVAAINPGAQEVCDPSNVDEDCDLNADDADTSATGKVGYFTDADGDTYGTGSSILKCDQPTASAIRAGDCKDSDASYNPGVTEVCDNADKDCDGIADDLDAIDKVTYFVDTDLDTFGGTNKATSCSARAGLTLVPGDCDDNEPDAYPTNIEICDDLDNNCNTVADDDEATDRQEWYTDVDGDTYGNAKETVFTCEPPVGYVALADDCDPTDKSIHPGAIELCDNLDSNCNGDTTDAPADTPFWPDLDGDSYGDETADPVTGCIPPAGYVANDEDCDDRFPEISPTSDEVPDNGIDENCDGEDEITEDTDTDTDTGDTDTGGDADTDTDSDSDTDSDTDADSDSDSDADSDADPQREPPADGDPNGLFGAPAGAGCDCGEGSGSASALLIPLLFLGLWRRRRIVAA